MQDRMGEALPGRQKSKKTYKKACSFAASRSHGSQWQEFNILREISWSSGQASFPT